MPKRSPEVNAVMRPNISPQRLLGPVQQGLVEGQLPGSEVTWGGVRAGDVETWHSVAARATHGPFPGTLARTASLSRTRASHTAGFQQPVWRRAPDAGGPRAPLALPAPPPSGHTSSAIGNSAIRRKPCSKTAPRPPSPFSLWPGPQLALQGGPASAFVGGRDGEPHHPSLRPRTPRW